MKPTVFEQIELKAPIDSPVLTGTPKSPTPSASAASTQIATKGYIADQSYVPGKLYSGSLASLKTTGLYRLSPSCTGYPSGYPSTAYNMTSVLVIGSGLYDTIQVYFSGYHIFYRKYFAVSSTSSSGTTTVSYQNTGWQEIQLPSSTGTFVKKSGDTMTGKLTAQNNANYTTKQVRNITISQDEPSGGGNGDIWLRYE